MQNYFMSTLITWKPNSMRREIQLELGEEANSIRIRRHKLPHRIET